MNNIDHIAAVPAGKPPFVIQSIHPNTLTPLTLSLQHPMTSVPSRKMYSGRTQRMRPEGLKMPQIQILMELDGTCLENSNPWTTVGMMVFTLPETCLVGFMAHKDQDSDQCHSLHLSLVLMLWLISVKASIADYVLNVFVAHFLILVAKNFEVGWLSSVNTKLLFCIAELFSCNSCSCFILPVRDEFDKNWTCVLEVRGQRGKRPMDSKLRVPVIPKGQSFS